MFTVRRVTAAETRPLRQRVLRPHQTPEALVWPHDDAPETLHAGAFEAGAMIATGTIHREPPPTDHFADRASDATAWRLRGMATDPEHRSRGCGAAVVTTCLDHARAHGGTIVWCTARIRAVPFYERLGFNTHGDVYDVPGIGPHYVMSRPLRD